MVAHPRCGRQSIAGLRPPAWRRIRSRTCRAGGRGAHPAVGPGAHAGDSGEDHSLTSSQRPGPTIVRALLRELAPPSGIALAGLSAVVWTKSLVAYSDLVLNRGLDPSAVFSLAILQLVPVMAQLLPFALLVGILVGLGRMREDLEVLALEACGVPAHRLVLPVLGAGLTAALAGVALHQLVSPPALQRVRETLIDVVLRTPGATLRPGIVQAFGDRRIEAREVSAHGDVLRGVLLWMPDVGEMVYADEASLGQDREGEASLVLRKGTVLLPPGDEARELRFERLSTELSRDAVSEVGDTLDPLTAAPASDLAEIAARDPDAGRRLRAASEGARRSALPSSALAFALLAAPLALGPRRFSRALGAVAGLGATVAYYGLVQLGSGLARAELLSARSAAWLPNAVAAGIGALLLVALVRARFREEAPSRRRALGSMRARPRRFALDRMVAATFLETAALALAALVVAYLLVDVLERLQWFARYDASFGAAARWYAARLPLLAARVMPMALLAGAALGVARLARTGELVAMQASGWSTLRCVAPVLLLAVLAAPLQVVLDEVVLPATNRHADLVKSTQIKRSAGPGARSVWYRDGDRVLRAASLDARLGTATDVSVYELDEDGRPTRRIDARAAQHIGHDEWRLEDAHAVQIGPRGIEPVPAPDHIRLAEERDVLDPMHLGAHDLDRAIDELERDGFDVSTHRIDLAQRALPPIACLLLPIVGVLLAVTGPPFPSPALALVASAVIGVAFQLVVSVAVSLGYGGTLGPLGSVAVPASVLALLALLLARRAQR